MSLRRGTQRGQRGRGRREEFFNTKIAKGSKGEKMKIGGREDPTRIRI